MNETSKKQTTQVVSTPRRKLLKKLSYSPPLLLCLGSLTKPSVAEADHGTTFALVTYWQFFIEEGMAYSNSAEADFASSTYIEGSQHPDFIAWMGQHFSAETIASMPAMASGPVSIP